MTNQKLHQILTFLIALVWIVNGLFCKVLDMVPRHRLIVSHILGSEHARLLTTLIGISETLMAIWIMSGLRSRFNAVVQIFVITMMNLMEFILVPNLLLWGRWNALFALLFIGIIYYSEFILNAQNSKWNP